MSLLTQLYNLQWLLAFIVLLVHLISKYRAYRRLSALKGPFSTGWSEMWHSYQIIGSRSHLAYQDVNDRYGEYDVSQFVKYHD
jgi:hypothetical protein